MQLHMNTNYYKKTIANNANEYTIVAVRFLTVFDFILGRLFFNFLHWYTRNIETQMVIDRGLFITLKDNTRNENHIHSYIWVTMEKWYPLLSVLCYVYILSTKIMKFGKKRLEIGKFL